MQEIIHRILERAVMAPSGHNAQPWEFSIKENRIDVYLLPERDQTIFNFEQRGSYIAHGALLENIEIAALYNGYKCLIQLFPNTEQKYHTATVILESTEAQQHPLYDAIEKRSTNRRPYKLTPLDSAHLAELERVSEGKVQFIEDKERKEELARIFSLNEFLVLNNYNMHQALFPHILWSDKENQEKKVGLYIETLELPPPAKAAFKLLKHWKATKILARIGFPKKVAAENAKLYASSSAIGLLSTTDLKLASLIQTGRTLQRIWLTATTLGLSMQPVTALIYLSQRVESGETNMFSEKESSMIREACSRIATIFNVPKETMAMTFRIGYDKGPSSVALKLAPNYTT